MYELEKRVVKASESIKDKRIEELERVIRDRDIEIDRLKKEYRVGLEREIIEIEKKFSWEFRRGYRWIREYKSGTR